MPTNSPADNLVTLAAPNGPAAEAYRALRTNLLVALPGQGPHRVLFASPEADDAVSEVLANIAVVLAGSGRRVTVVDGNLRRPQQHTLFGLPGDRGLSELLQAPPGGIGPAPVLAAAVDGVRVLPAGTVPTGPAELLAREGLDARLAALAAETDWLLVSAPPILAVTDAAILAQHVDGVILVLTAGESRRDRTAEARARLDAVGARTLGVVLVGAGAPVAAPY